jgi:hypothetical protein
LGVGVLKSSKVIVSHPTFTLIPLQFPGPLLTDNVVPGGPEIGERVKQIGNGSGRFG